MGNRRRSRTLALDVLYEQEVSAAPAEEILQRYEDHSGYDYACELVLGVLSNRGKIDEMIAAHARDWALGRMPVVDRTLLRIALYELLGAQVPPAVAINEAVELAKDYSTDDSGRFVNGVLSAALTGLDSGKAGIEPIA